MSNLSTRTTAIEARGRSAPIPILEVYPARPADLGKGLTVNRALPHRLRRLIGPWCFLDHFGPIEIEDGVGLDVPPHPHIGLQTVTWIFEGQVLHKDSLGHQQIIRPGELNLMTAGRGIAHSEETQGTSTKLLHGLQLWTALPEIHRKCEPSFDRHQNLPSVSFGNCRVVVFMGQLGNQRSPARTFSPVVGAEITATANGKADLHFDPNFEYALFLINGRASMQDIVMQPNTLYYFGIGRMGINLELDLASKMILLGGAPFPEKILMWWNFVGRSSEEILAAREQWERGGFGSIPAYDGDRLAAPTFQIRMKK